MGSTTSSDFNTNEYTNAETYRLIKECIDENENRECDGEDVEYQEDNYEENMRRSQRRLAQLEKVQKEALNLFEKKNRDYGDAFASYGVVGVLVRIGDKIQRTASISKNGVTMVNNENIRDTLVDLANYASMAVMLLDELDD